MKRRLQQTGASRSPKVLEIACEDSEGVTRVPYMGKPHLVFYVPSSAGSHAAALLQESDVHKDGLVRVSTVPSAPEATWLYFNRRVLSAIVRLDAYTLPAKEECKEDWPTRVVATRSGVAHEATLSKGLTLPGGFVSEVRTFDDALAGTDVFWTPLEWSVFDPREIDVIRQVAAARGTPEPKAKQYEIDFDNRILMVAGKPRELTPNQNAVIRYFWQDKQEHGGRYFHTSFQEAATAADIRSRNMNQVFKVGQERGGNLAIMRLLFKKSTGDHWILAADLQQRVP